MGQTGCIGCLDTTANNRVTKPMAKGAIYLGIGVAVVATLVALTVLSALAGGYIQTGLGITTGVSQTALTTILEIAKWSGVAAGSGIGLTLLALLIQKVQDKIHDKALTKSYSDYTENE